MEKVSKDTLGDRIKGYENHTRFYLERKVPVMLRIDGKSFHTWTKKNIKDHHMYEDTPFSDFLHDTFVNTTKYLMNQIQGAKLGYT